MTHFEFTDFLNKYYCLRLARQPPQWDRAPSFTRFLDHTQRRTTVGRTSLDELSARCRDLYLTTQDNHNRQTDSPPPWDSNPQSQQASNRRLTPSTAWPLGPANKCYDVLRRVRKVLYLCPALITHGQCCVNESPCINGCGRE